MLPIPNLDGYLIDVDGQVWSDLVRCSNVRYSNGRQGLLCTLLIPLNDIVSSQYYMANIMVYISGVK